jgi:glycolate oxidase
MRLREIIGAEHVIVDADKVEPYAQDAVKEKFPPEAVLLPRTSVEIAAILRLANEARFPVTARGGGVGYTGGAVPVEGGVVIGTDRMNQIREINPDDLYVVTEPGVTKRTDSFIRPTLLLTRILSSAATSQKTQAEYALLSTA